MMRDPITDAAQDPSCLLCLTPDRGGSWWSRLRPAQLRNFAADPMTWTDAKTALDKIDQSHDFTFEIEFKCVETNAVYVFASDASRDFIRVFMSAGQVIVNSALMSTSPGGSTQFSAGSDSTNRHALTVKMIKNTITALIDGEIVYTRENLVRNAIEISAPRSNAGYVYKISITDDTTGEIVWQAAYSDLYDTSNPWPSPVPENFAENAKAFYDCQAVVQEALDPTHDYSFLIEADRVSERTENSLFYAGTDKLPFGVYYHADHTIKFFTNLLRNEGDPSGTYASLNFYTGTDWLPGRHAFEARIEGNAITTYVDGVQCATSNKFARTGTAAVGLPNCNSGYVYKIQITDLTDNQVVWSYPSEAERVRLITKTNVRTDRGAFEAADETQPARVDTALDLRGKVSSYTVVVDFEAAEFPETTTMECHQELAGQGGALIGSGTPPICSIGYYLASSGSARLQLSQEVAGGRHVVNATLTGRLSGRHICCGVVEVDPAAPLTASTLYLDGVRIGNASIYAVPTGNAAVSARCFSIAGHSFTGGWASYTGKVYSCLLFDRALSAAEIAALTPKKQPLSWAGIRDVVRRGRAQRYFAVGDVLTIATPRWTIEYEVTGFDQVEPADAALTHSMTLLPVRLVTNLQFDAPEPGNPDANRAQYGCNRWDWSAIRQWLNSAAAPGEWWTAQHEYDAAPDYAATLAGFMADLPADFLSAVAPARLVTALPNADGGGSVETVDRFWLPSRTEIFGALDGGMPEGVQMAKYIDATDANRIKYNAAGNSASWYLRSANTSQPHYVAFVERTGIFSTSFLVSRYVLPACIIA
ncbi:DUF6273 domain-containing protein [Victivallis lenta]|uniref:DUF6273 domain-containing protein n=1 Tax=Victivallis lenta TaxID=2606640 RepID=UPI003AF24601